MLTDTDVAVLAIAVAFCNNDKKKKKKRWMKNWYKERQKYSNVNLLNELRFNEPDDYQNFLRLDSSTFDKLLALIEVQIKKQDTCMRDAIPPSQRLSITLRYLATGNSFEDLKFTSAVSPQSIRLIVMETCHAIIHALRDFIQVRKMHCR